MKRNSVIILSVLLIIVLSFFLNNQFVRPAKVLPKLLQTTITRISRLNMTGEKAHAGVTENINTRSIEGNPESPTSAAEEAYHQRAYPNTTIDPVQQQQSYNAFLKISKLPGGKKTNWQEVGPITPIVDYWASFTLTSGMASGRVTALALSPACSVNDCKIFVGAAGGGIWEADNAMASQPNWHPSNNGIPSNSIGSLLFDPTDPTYSTLYAGTGEGNGSADSEAGVGLYKSTDFGKNWVLVSGSVPVSFGRSIAAIGIDPANASHIFIGTEVARHG